MKPRTGNREPATAWTCFALAAAAKLDAVDVLTIRSDGGGGSATAAVSAAAASTSVSTMSTDPRRYSFYSPEMTLLAESEHTTAATPPVQYEYVWFGGVPVAQHSYSVPTEPLAATDLVWTVTDHLGTPKLQTDANQNIVWHAEHEPYGQIYVLRTGEGRHQPLRFPGQEAEQLGVDSANGVSERSYNIFRWYRPAAGRYSQADPIGLSLGGSRYGLNHLYSYAALNPLSLADFSGLIAVDPSCGEGGKLLIDEAMKKIKGADFAGCVECGLGFTGEELKDKIANMTVHCVGKNQGYYKIPDSHCGVAYLREEPPGH